MKANIFFASILIVFFAAQFNLPINNNRSSHYSKACYSKEEFPENSNDCSPFLNSFSKEEPLQKSEFAEYVRNNNDIILPADNGVLIIGRLTGETDNESFPSNNEAVFIINDRVPSQQQAYLEYDLFGLEDFTCVNRSINDLISQGGKIIRFRNEWSHQVEKIDVSDLQKGTNIIRFHTPEDTRFQYKIKNVSIRFAEPLSKKREIVINLPSNPAHYGQYAYINGFVFSGDTTSYTLLANGKTVSVFDSHFEDIVTLADTNNPTVELTVFFNDGKTCSTTIVYNEDKKYHYLSNNTWVVPFYKTSVFPKKNNYVNFKGISIITEENAVKNKKEISIIGLRNEDMPQMGAGMVNVTAEYKGYRCLPHETKFETSVDVHLSYDSLLLPRNYTTEDIRTFHYNKSKRSWEMIEYVGIDKDKKQIISKAYQFDDFINAVLKTPDLPQTSGYTPTTMKNMAYADPVAHVNIIAPPKANNMGTANLSYQINIPAGRQGLQPQLSVVYNSEKNTGIPGNGWDIPFTNISVETRWGVPSYDNTKETEEYLLNGEQLVELQIEGGDTNRLPLVHTTAFRNRNTSDVTYYAYRVEGAFSRIIRHGTNPTNYWWEVVDKNGTTYIYSYNCISKWHLAEVRDLYGNNINYEYASNCNLNPDKIYYTGHDSIKGIYSVEFLHGDLSADIRTSARSGFLENENAPIEQVLIKCKNEFIKGYFFKYKTGAYNKKLLCAIVDYTDSSTVESIREKDCDQLQTDYIHGTQTHIFQYYEDEGLDFQTSPTTIFAEAESDEKAFGLFTDPNHQTIGRSKSLTLGAGGSICLGFGKEIFSKKNSVGANINFSYSPLTEKVQLLDINGDGLLDKVVKHNSDYKLYPGYLNGSNELYFNSSSSTISGLSKLSRSSNITWGLGLEAQWNFLGALHGSLSLSKSWNKQTSDRYFVDINGDGFVDFIKQGSIYNNVNGTFSVVDDNGIIKSPDDSCYFTTYTGTIDSSFYSQESESTFSFRRDPVKFWIAPTTTDVLIKSYIKRINPSNSNKRIIYNIQVGNSIILTDSIEPNDTIIHFDSICPISVSAGTPVFFHMHSTNPIGSDEIAWVPSVYIVKSCQPSTVQYDADENTVNRYNYSKDALLSDQQYFMAPLKGHIILNGHISSPAQSDTLTFIIKHNQSLLTDTIFPDNQSFNHNFNYDLSVNENDSVLFKLNSNTNVNWTDIDFQAKVQYYQADSFPALDTSNAYLSVEPYYPSLQMSAFPRAAVISTPHYFTADTFSFSPNITFTNNNSVNGQVVVTAKSKRKLLCKKNLTLINGIIQNPPIINLNLNSGDTICFDFFTTNINIGEKVVSANVTALDTNLSYPSGFYYLFPDSLKKFGNLYRQWGQFSFYDTLNPLFIDQSKCFNAFPDSAALNNIPVGSIDTTSTYDDVNDIFSSLGVHDVNSIYFMPLMVNNKEKRWDDLMKSVCISPLTIINQDGFQYIYNNI
ncbi:MAG: hypothetical protein HY951_01260, partial [Bacteroidia bacterium]|nr:hypothetical protein [Bacteroidia bacterium]